MTTRKRSARILVTALGGLSVLGLTACGGGVTSAAPTESTGQAVTIENCGRTVVVPGTPAAVVGTAPVPDGAAAATRTRRPPGRTGAGHRAGTSR